VLKEGGTVKIADVRSLFHSYTHSVSFLQPQVSHQCHDGHHNSRQKHEHRIRLAHLAAADYLPPGMFQRIAILPAIFLHDTPT